MFGMDTKSFLIGVALGFLVLPRLQTLVMGAVSPKGAR